MDASIRDYLEQRKTGIHPDLTSSVLGSLGQDHSEEGEAFNLRDEKINEAFRALLSDVTRLYGKSDKFNAEDFCVIVKRLASLPKDLIDKFSGQYVAAGRHLCDAAELNFKKIDFDQVLLLTRCLTRFQCNNPSLCLKIADSVCRPDNLVNLGLGDCVSVLETFAKLHIDEPEKLFDCLVGKIEKYGGDLLPHHLSRTVWSLTTLALQQYRDFVSDLTKEAIGKIEEFERPGDIAKLAWGLCFYGRDLVRSFLAVIDHEKYQLTASEQRQLNTAYIIAGLPPPFSHQDRKLNESNRKAEPSRSEKVLLKSLLKFGFTQEEIVFAESISGIQTDFIALGEHVWDFEDDGRTHFTSSRRILGRDHIQDLLLLSGGCIPVHIDWNEFPLGADAEEKRQSCLKVAFTIARKQFSSLVDKEAEDALRQRLLAPI